MDQTHEINISNAIAILEVARRLALSYDLDELLGLIINETTRVLNCERASIFLYDPNRNELYSKIATGVEQIRVPIDCGIVGACVRTGKLINVHDAYADPRFHREVDQKLGYKTRNILSCPLIGFDNKLVGVLQAINKNDGNFDKTDEWAIETLAAQAAVALQRAKLLQEYAEKQRLERELDLAREIQQSFLPQKNPTVENYQIAGWNRPAEQTGGDCYDFIYPENADKTSRLGILLADASGHGIAPALIVSQLRAIIRSLFGLHVSISETLKQANNILCNDLPLNRFITAFYGLLNPNDNTLTYCSAGQGPIIHIKHSNEVEIRNATLCPLGVLENIEFKEDNPIYFEPDNITILLTDGFFEWRNPKGEQFGIHRIVDFFKNNQNLPADELLSKLITTVENFTRPTVQEDDLTCIIIKRTE